MAVINNVLTEIGDTILYSTDTPIVGISQLTGYTDEVIGELVDRYFLREFRYSLDGINFANWMPLTNINVQSIVFNNYNLYKVEYRYTRSGTNAIGGLQFIKVELTGIVVIPECSLIFKKSIFSYFFNCNNPELLGWSINVLEKIYKPGIVPKYITRGENNNLDGEDTDFLSFWKSVTDFFAMIVLYARNIGKIYVVKELLEKYLDSKGMFIFNDITYEELRYLMAKYHREISLRGGIESVLTKNDSGKIIDGEVLRLINYNIFEEFIFCLCEIEKVSWTINKSSPLHNGSKQLVNAIKGYSFESNISVDDISNYPILGNVGSTLFPTIIDKQNVESVLTISNVLGGGVAGIGYKSGITNLDDYSIIVNPNISYEITFWIYDKSNTGGLENQSLITFGANSFDKYGIEISMLGINNLLSNNYFFKLQKLPRNERWYFVRGIIFDKNQSVNTSKLNLGYGNHLRFLDERVSKIVPYIVVDNETGGYVANSLISIWDFKVRPLNAPNVSFVGLYNQIYIWLKNNNKQYSLEQLYNILRKDFISYNSVFTLIDLENE